MTLPMDSLLVCPEIRHIAELLAAAGHIASRGHVVAWIVELAA